LFMSHSLFIIMMLFLFLLYFFFNDTATTEIYTLSLHDALPICRWEASLSEATHVSAAGGVDDETVGLVIAAAAEVGGVDESRTHRIHLRHEGVVRATAEAWLEGCCGRWEASLSEATHVSAAGGVHRDAALTWVRSEEHT